MLARAALALLLSMSVGCLGGGGTAPSPGESSPSGDDSSAGLDDSSSGPFDPSDESSADNSSTTGDGSSGDATTDETGSLTEDTTGISSDETGSETNGTDASDTDASDTDASDTNASDTNSSDTNSSDTDASDTNSSDTDSSDTDSSDTDASDTDSSDTDSSDTDASDTDASSEETGDSGGDEELPVACDEDPGELLTVGQAGHLLLRGTIVTPDEVFDGEVLVVNDRIACVDASCADVSEAATATAVETHGIIFPGLIDTHNHVLFNVFDETHWTPEVAYTHASQWSGSDGDATYARALRAKQYLNGETLSGVQSPVDLNCELDKYGELKALVAGTTSMVGAANPAHRICYSSLVRTINSTVYDVQVASIWPSSSAANDVCENFEETSTDAYVIHVAEGISETARNQFSTLYTTTNPDGCLFESRTAIVHGNALTEAQFEQMGASGMGLVWSPRSNVGLYGLGVDLSVTTDIPAALSHGINVSLAPDWTMSGSQNVLDELRFAQRVSETLWDGLLTPQMLVEMVTINAARNLALDDELGTIEVGKRADLMVVSGDPLRPHESLIASTPANVRLVLVDGVVLYGDLNLEEAANSGADCETVELCGCEKFVCVASPEGTPDQLLWQSFADIESALADALATYDADGWPGLNDPPEVPLSPMSPLYRCPG